MIEFFKTVIGWLLYFVSFLFPRDKDKYVFGSNMGGVNDNPKYLYLYLQSIGGKKLIWITPNSDKNYIEDHHYKGFKMYYRWSIIGLWHSLTGKYYFVSSYVSDINFYTSGGTFLVNLWHGIGLKKIEFNIKEGILAEKYKGTLKNRFFYSNLYSKPDKFLSTSRLMSEKTFCPAFRINRSNCLEFGYPRTDLFFLDEHKINNFLMDFESEEICNLSKKFKEYFTYVYMPTWRDVGGDFLDVAGFDFEMLNKVLEESNSLFVLKLHPNTNLPISRVEKCKNILIISNKLDIYPLLPYSDVLITDYSSIFYDYLLLRDKGILLFPFDYHSYLKDSRDFVLDYFEYTKARFVNSFRELLSSIELREYTNTNDLTEIKKLFWGDYEGGACKKLTDFIEKIS